MVVKIYVSGMSGNKEVKKRQQRVLMILDSKHITYELIDITEPGKESSKEYMQNNSKSNGGTVSDPNPRHPLPPQLFNDDEYCGDYDQFDLANEIDTLEQFLKVEVPPEAQFEEKTDESPKESELKNGLPDAKSTEDKEGEEKTVEADSKEKSEERESSPKKSVERETSLQNNEAKENHDEKELTPKIEDEGDSSSEVQDMKENEREATPKTDDEKTKSKESTPVKNDVKDGAEGSDVESEEEEEQDNRQANGTASSRESSQEVEEKVTEERKSENDADLKKDLSPSEKLILSEAAAE